MELAGKVGVPFEAWAVEGVLRGLDVVEGGAEPRLIAGCGSSFDSAVRACAAHGELAVPCPRSTWLAGWGSTPSAAPAPSPPVLSAECTPGRLEESASASVRRRAPAPSASRPCRRPRTGRCP